MNTKEELIQELETILDEEVVSKIHFLTKHNNRTTCDISGIERCVDKVYTHDLSLQVHSGDHRAPSELHNMLVRASLERLIVSNLVIVEDNGAISTIILRRYRLSDNTVQENNIDIMGLHPAVSCRLLVKEVARLNKELDDVKRQQGTFKSRPW